jgi:hypothetical protein
VFLLAAEGAHGVASEDVAWIGVLVYHQCKVDHWSFPDGYVPWGAGHATLVGWMFVTHVVVVVVWCLGHE